MSQTTAGRWVRLQDGERFVGDLWPGSDERQRRETLISTLWSGKVPMRARMAAKPRDADLQPALPNLERQGSLGSSTQIPGIESLLLQADPRTINVDIPAGHIVISAFIANDDQGLWAPFFPGWLTTAAGRFIVIEFDDVEFDRAAAHAYLVENLLPDGARPSEEVAGAEQWLRENVLPAGGMPDDADAEEIPRSRRGRLPKYDWDAIHAEFLRLMRHHGEFSYDKPKWNGQARLEDALLKFCLDTFSKEPSLSLLREKIPGWFAEWRSQKQPVGK